MANAKSVIEIELKDEKFKAFQATFEKHKKAVEAMQEEWSKISDSIANVGKKQEGFNKAIKDGSHALREVASTTGTIAKNLASSALSVGKWLALGALGGGFGLGGLAASASDYRRRAQGLGVSTGDLRAGGVTLGRYINAESTMGNIADIQSDLSRRQILSRLGGGVGQNPAEMLPALMQNAVKLFKQGGQTSQYAEAMGLTQVFTLQELRRLASLSEEKLKKTIADFEESRKRLEVTDTMDRQWQDFWFKLREAGQTLETSLIKTLSSLTPKLIEFSEAVVKAIADFLSSDKAKKAVEDFAAYLSSPEFKEDVQSFMDALKELAAFIVDMVGYLPTKSANLRGSAEAAKGNWWEASKTMGASDYLSARFNMLTAGAGGTSAQQAYLNGLEKKYGLPPGVLDSVWAAESSRGVNMESPKGALGHFGFMPKTAKEYDLKDPNDFVSSADAASRKIKNLMRYYKKDVEKALAAYNWGEGNLDADIESHGEKWKKYLPIDAANTNYLQKFSIRIDNNTGNSTITSVNSLPGVPR